MNRIGQPIQRSQPTKQIVPKREKSDGGKCMIRKKISKSGAETVEFSESCKPEHIKAFQEQNSLSHDKMGERGLVDEE